MMGRTPSTMTTDSLYSDNQIIEPSPSCPNFGQQLALLEVTRAFSILERTIVEASKKRTTSLTHLEALTQELQEATAGIPYELRALTTENPKQEQVLRNSNVACGYYFVMMMLTRPFLLVSMQMEGSRSVRISEEYTKPFEPEPKVFDTVTHGAMVSFDSAIRLIRLLHELLVADLLFNNMAFVT